jgi:autotransporter-associated beta strand protein
MSGETATMKFKQKSRSTAAIRTIVWLALVGFGNRASSAIYWDTDGPLKGATPSTNAVGTWGSDNYWTDKPNGNTTTSAWTPGEQAVFSSGSDATGTFSVGVLGNQVASGISFQEGTVTLIGGTITLIDGVGGAAISVANGISAGINSTIAGTNGLSKTSSGTLTLGGANTYSGTTDVGAGTLLIGNDSALGSSTLNLSGGTVGSQGPHTVNNTVLLSANSTIGGSDNLSFAGNFSQSGNRTLTFNNSGLTVFSGPTFTLSDSGTRTLTLNINGGGVLISSVVQNGPSSTGDSLVKNGTGTLTLSGNNTFSGPLTVNGGALQLGTGSAGRGTLVFGPGTTLQEPAGPAVTIGNNINFTGGGNRTFQIDNTTTASGLISGAGSQLTKTGVGNLIFSGSSANTFSGGLTVNSGTVTAAKVNGFGSGPLVVNSGTADIGTFNQTATSVTLVSGTISGTSGLLSSSSYALQSGTVSAQLGGAASLTKTTTGTVNLTGANTYTGTTTVSGGTLKANNATGSATGTGTVTVNSGGTLGGSGRISGPVVLNAGATISPGNSPGTLSTGSQTWNSGATYLAEINSVSAGEGIGWDFLNIAGTLTLNATSASQINFNLRSLTAANALGPVQDFNGTVSYTWRFITTTGGILLNPGQTIGGVLKVSLAEFSNPIGNGQFNFSLANGNKDLMVSYTGSTIPVPEPDSKYMAGLGLLLFFFRRRIFRWSYDERKK